MKIIFAVAAALVIIIGYVPYFKDLFAKKTTPHIYTWLIWLITQGTAVAALIYGGGGLGSISLIVGLILVGVVFLLSFKYGTKNITTSDTVFLALALLAIVVWWQLDQPILSVIMISLIDALAYVPTFRKTYQDPYSETVSFWMLISVSGVLAILSNTEYNLLTVLYLSVSVVANTILFVMIIIRRKSMKNLL